MDNLTEAGHVIATNDLFVGYILEDISIMYMKNIDIFLINLQKSLRINDIKTRSTSLKKWEVRTRSSSIIETLFQSGEEMWHLNVYLVFTNDT